MMNAEVMPADAVKDDAQTTSETFTEIMDHFAYARSMLTVCHRSLCTIERPEGAEEIEVLGEALEKLRIVYNEFDLFAMSAF